MPDDLFPCTQCHASKPLNAFYPSTHQKLQAGKKQRCKACQDTCTRAWRIAHPEATQVFNKRGYVKNRVKVAAGAARWAKKHPEHRRLLTRLGARRRRASHRGTGISTLTYKQWLEMQAAQGYCCAYCGKRCQDRLTQDHLTPISKGGLHILHNVLAACLSCNQRKHTGPPPIPVQPFLLTIAPSRKKKVS